MLSICRVYGGPPRAGDNDQLSPWQAVEFVVCIFQRQKGVYVKPALVAMIIEDHEGFAPAVHKLLYRHSCIGTSPWPVTRSCQGGCNAAIAQAMFRLIRPHLCHR